MLLMNTIIALFLMRWLHDFLQMLGFVHIMAFDSGFLMMAFIWIFSTMTLSYYYISLYGSYWTGLFFVVDMKWAGPVL